MKFRLLFLFHVVLTAHLAFGQKNVILYDSFKLEQNSVSKSDYSITIKELDSAKAANLRIKVGPQPSSPLPEKNLSAKPDAGGVLTLDIKKLLSGKTTTISISKKDDPLVSISFVFELSTGRNSIYYRAMSVNLSSIEVLKESKDTSDLFVKYKSPSAQSNAGDFIKGISGMDVTTPVEGLALFMIDRAKQELNITFFEKFRKYTELNPEIQVLFPKTSATLTNMLSYQYPQMLSALRVAFNEDLRLLAYHIDDIFELPEYKKILLAFPEIRIAIHSVRYIHQLEAGDIHPALMLRQFSVLEEWNAKNLSVSFKNAGNGLKLANIFSESLYKTEDSVWVSPRELSALVMDNVRFKVYLEMIYDEVKNKKIYFYKSEKDSLSFASVMEKEKDNIFLFRNLLVEFVELSDRLEKSRRKLKNSEKLNEDYYTFVNASIDLIEYSFDVVRMFDSRFVSARFIKMARNGNDLYRNIYMKEYPAAVANLNNILVVIDTIVSGKLSGKEKDAWEKFSKQIPKISKYSLFIANVAQAKTPEEVEQVIESAALPVGSSSIKKNSVFNLSIQSYLGVYNAFYPKSGATAWSSKYGISAPVGLSANFGFRKGGSISLFGSLIDIGAVVDYRLKYDSSASQVNKEYKIELGNIFSPGIFIVYGLPFNIPVSVGYGGQYGPGLNDVSTSGVNVVNKPYWRENIFVSVDIPLFNLLNVASKKPYWICRRKK